MFRQNLTKLAHLLIFSPNVKVTKQLYKMLWKRKMVSYFLVCCCLVV